MNTRRTLTIIALASALALTAAGQNMDTGSAPPLPTNGAFAGLGYRQASTPQITGWVEVFHRNPDVNILGLTLPSYTGAATDYSGDVTSARINLYTVLPHGPRLRWLAFGTKTGAGVAYNANGVGGSFDGGGWATADISRLTGIDGAKLSGSATWLKNDVAAAVKLGPVAQVLRALGSTACYRFGIGKTWGGQ